MKTCYLIFLCFFTSIIGVGDCYGQEDSNIPDSIAITGVVVDESNKPIFNSIIELLHNGVIINETITDRNGKFRINSKGHSNIDLSIRYIAYKGYNFNNITSSISNLKIVLYNDPDFNDFEIIIPGCTPTRKFYSEIQHCPAHTVMEPLLFDVSSFGFIKTITSYELEHNAY